MTSNITKSDSSQPVTGWPVYLFDDWFDPIEAQVRERVRGFIQAMIESELDETLQRPRYKRPAQSSDGETEASTAVAGHRHGHRTRSLTGTFGKVAIDVPRARLQAADGKTTEWRSNVLRAYQRRTLAADAVIAGTYLAGTNTRRVRRALKALFGGAVSKDTVSRVWRKVKADWDNWNGRSLTDEPIVRLISTARWWMCGSTARRLRSRCWSSSACARMARRCCSRSRAWAGRALKPGAACLMTSLVVACVALSC
jgi:hypothetical protein